VFSAALGHGQVTYSKEVSRVVRQKCRICHRAGDIAPFAITGCRDVVTWNEDIERVLTDRTMPPWKPVAGHGDFQSFNAPADDERQMVLDWIAAGMAEGDPADLPQAGTQTGEWELGDPDVVLRMSQVCTPPHVRDQYRCFSIPTDLPDSRFVSAMRIVPGNRRIVHHVLLFVDTSGDSAKLDGQEGEPLLSSAIDELLDGLLFLRRE
jgi:hypothetical protein